MAITQAICEYRAQNGVTGPLFLAKDTHALSEPAFVSALEVLAANGVGCDDRRRIWDTRPHRRYLMRCLPTIAIERRAFRRHRDHAVTQPAGGWRIQVQPAQRRSCRYDRDQGYREPRERSDGARIRDNRRVCRFARALRRHDASIRLCFGLRRSIWRTSSIWTQFVAPGCDCGGSARRGRCRVLGSYQRASETRSRDSESPMSIRRSGSCRSIGMARFAWIARLPMRWPA